MTTKNNILKVIFGWLLKFFIPPMIGSFVLSFLSEIHFFYENYDFMIMLDETPIKVFIFNIASKFITYFYAYYLIVYIPFFIYLVLIQKLNKLSLLVVVASGFIYGLSPLLFSNVNSLNDLLLDLNSLLILLATAFSGTLCALTYYYLHKLIKS